MRVSCYLQIVPTLRNGRAVGARVERVTQDRPRDPLPAAVLMQVTLDVPAAVFAPLEAHGQIPETARIVPFAIEVEDGDAS